MKKTKLNPRQKRALKILVISFSLAITQGCARTPDASEITKTFTFTADDFWIYTWIELAPGDEVEITSSGSATSMNPNYKADTGRQERITLDPAGLNKEKTDQIVISSALEQLEKEKPAAHLPGGAVILRVGQKYFWGGRSSRTRIPDGAAGTLCLGLNMKEDPGYRAGFRGQFNVVVKVRKTAAN